MDRQRDNRRRARRVIAVLVGVPVIVSALLGGVIGGIAPGLLIGAVTGLVIGSIVTVGVVRTATARVLRDLGARPLGSGEHPRIANLLDGLCLTSGVPQPRIWMLDSDAADAWVVGTGPNDAAVVVTTALADELGRIELEGLLAHALMRIRHLDVVPATLVAATGPLMGRFTGRILAPDRLIAADLDACQLTRYPPGLAHAFEQIGNIGDGTPSVTPQRASYRAHLSVAPTPDDASTHPPLDERIALLREL